jgi:hypothetical protein
MLRKFRIALAATLLALAAISAVDSASASVLQVPEGEVTRDGRTVSGMNARSGGSSLIL